MFKRSAMALVLALAACGGGSKGSPPPVVGTGGDTGSGPATTGGAGGAEASGGTVGTSSGGSGGETASADAASPGTGGGGEVTVDAALPTPSSDGGGAAPSNDGGAGPTPMGMGHEGSLGMYEAEQGLVTGRAQKSKCKACPSSMTMKAGDSCCSAGGQVTWVVAHGNGEVQFNGVMAPADGMYDVTWWYYCANDDNFGDKNCGGQTTPPTTKSGCRPHQFYVNDALMPGAYHFPCFGGAWSVVRTATVTTPLKAGPNTIKLHAPPPRDSANVDAIEIYPAGKGLPPSIMSSTDLTGK